MEARETALHLYGSRSDRAALDWAWVRQQLVQAGTYWVVARSPGHPHPRPVWGVWTEPGLALSIGSPALLRALRADPAVTVHLDSGVDVVIVEGVAAPADAQAGPRTGPTARDDVEEAVAAYNRKYAWDYRVDRYGPLTRVAPTTVLAWRAAGPAGRDSFQATGRWTFDAPG